MINNLLLAALLACTALSFEAKAHEGHAQAPGSIKALHGGIVKPGTIFNIEILAEGENVKFFILPHDNETVDLSKIIIKATATPPKGKAEVLTLDKKEKSFEAKVNFKGKHRLTLDLQVTYENQNDKLQFLVERH